MASSSTSLSGFVKLLSNMVFIRVVHKYLMWTHWTHTLMSHSGCKTFITVSSSPISLFACLQTHNQPCSWLMDEVGRVKSDSTLCPLVALQPADFRDSVHRDFSFWVGGYMAVTIIQFGVAAQKHMVQSNTTRVCWCWGEFFVGFR